jgi:CheY-like chemotaxis protein
LAGGIAHDFNNMLGVIMGYCELAQWSIPADHAAQAHLAQMLKASDRAKDLVQQILTFSRHKEQGRVPLQLQPVLEETLQLLRVTLPASVEIRQQFDSHAAAILGDPTQIQQVVMNLSMNAFHAMGEQGGVLTVTLDTINVEADLASSHADLHEGKYLQLVVSDTGHGMERAILERIYDPFFTTKAPGEGTGLGLAVVHGVIKHHQGAITVFSEPGQGTTFKLYFPIHENAALMAESQTSTTISGGSARVLLVDDEAALAEVGKKMLEQMGYGVTFQTSGRQALEIFGAAPDDFDLVITDQTMPRMSGTELAKSLLALRPTLPILLTTGYSATLNLEQAHALGIRELLLKPYTAQALGGAIRRVLANARKG